MSWANKTAFVLICFTLVFVTMAYGGVHQPVLALFYVLTAAILILTAADALQVRAFRFDKNLLQVPLFAAALYGFVQVIPFGRLGEIAGLTGIPRTISSDPFSTQVNAFHFLALAIFFSALLVTLESASRIRKIVTVVIVFGFLFAFYAILQSVLSPNRIYGIYESRYAVPFGSFVNRHNFAAFMEMSVCVPLGMLFAGSVKRDRKLLFITGVSLMGVALILSGSRGGFAAMIAALIVLIFLTRQAGNRRQLALKGALAAALLAVIIGGAIFVGGETSLSRFVETAQSRDVSTNRFHIWSVTLKIIASNFPFGAGLGAFGVAFTQFDTNSGLERVEQAHNDYLQVASDAGLVGIALGGFFLFLLIKKGLKGSRTPNIFRRGVVVGAFAGCVAVLVHSLFDFVLHTTAISLLFLVLVGLVVAAGRSYPDDRTDGEPYPQRRRPAGSITDISQRKEFDNQ